MPLAEASWVVDEEEPHPPRGHLVPYRVQRARVTARRPRPACARPAGRRPPPIRSSPAGLHRRCCAHAAMAVGPAARRASPGSPHSRRATQAARPGSAPSSTQRCPIRFHHRLQDLQPGRDAQAMERFPDTVDHAKHRQWHLNRDGLRAGGLAGSPPPVMLRHGRLSSFLNPPCATATEQGRGVASRFTSSSTASGTSPGVTPARSRAGSSIGFMSCPVSLPEYSPSRRSS